MEIEGRNTEEGGVFLYSRQCDRKILKGINKGMEGKE